MKLAIATMGVLLGSLQLASAANNSIGFEIASDREPDDVGVPKDMKYQIDAAHTFGSGIILGGSFQYTDPTPSTGSADSQNLETTLGYRLKLGDAFSLFGSAGVGGRFSSSDDAFAYYVLRVGADLTLADRVTWNAVGYRYRNAFDTDNDYETPQLWTGLSFKIDRSNSLTTRIYRDWKDGAPDDTGAALGFKHDF